MSKKRSILFITVALLLIFVLTSLLTGCPAKQLRKPPIGPGPAGKPIVTGFYTDESGPDSSFASLQRNEKLIDVISPTWLTINMDGSLVDTTSMRTLRWAKDRGIRVIPLVMLAQSKDTVLALDNARLRAETAIIAAAQKYGFEGLNIDFEFIPTGPQSGAFDRTLITKFMQEIYPQLRKLNKEIDMAVFGQYETSPQIAGLYDYPKLSKLVDHFTIMTYDKHEASSPPGAVSPLGWVEGNIKRAIDLGLKPKQIGLGVATYGYDWPQGQQGGFSTPTKAVLEKAAVKGVQIKWDNGWQSPYYTYINNQGRPREVWFENSTTLKQKIALAKKYGLHGIDIWRLGYETPAQWQVIADNIGTRKGIR